MAIPNPAAGQVIRITHRASLGGQVGEFSQDYVVGPIVAGGVSLTVIANTYQALIDLNLPVILTNAATVEPCLASLHNPTTMTTLQSVHGNSARPVGTAGADAVPKQVAPVIAKSTGLAGPANRGRVYMPFADASFVDANGEITNAAQVLYNAYANANFIGLLVSSGGSSAQLTPVLSHRPKAPIIIWSTSDLTGWLTTSKLGTQKRRGDYGRPNVA